MLAKLLTELDGAVAATRSYEAAAAPSSSAGIFNKLTSTLFRRSRTSHGVGYAGSTWDSMWLSKASSTAPSSSSGRQLDALLTAVLEIICTDSDSGSSEEELGLLRDSRGLQWSLTSLLKALSSFSAVTDEGRTAVTTAALQSFQRLSRHSTLHVWLVESPEEESLFSLLRGLAGQARTYLDILTPLKEGEVPTGLMALAASIICTWEAVSSHHCSPFSAAVTDTPPDLGLAHTSSPSPQLLCAPFLGRNQVSPVPALCSAFPPAPLDFDFDFCASAEELRLYEQSLTALCFDTAPILSGVKAGTASYTYTSELSAFVPSPRER